MENFISKFGHKNDMVYKKEFTVVLTFKVVVPHNLTLILDELYQKTSICVNRMLEDRTKSSSKYYKEIPCVLAKSLVSKYQRNKKLKRVKALVLPVCGDKGKQVKVVEGGIRVPAFFKKSVLPAHFPKPISGFIRQVEFFKQDGKWFMSYSYNTPVLPEQKVQGFLGVDRNSVGNVAVCANVMTGKVRKFSPDTAGITKNFRNRRKNLQNGKNYKCSCSHFDHRDSNAAFNISANGWFFYEQTVGHSASAVGHIGGLLNQSSEKAVQLESSGGAR